MAISATPSEPPSERPRRSPLDPFVAQVAQWIADTPDGVSSVGLGAAIATEMDWPPPFAEAILASVKARRILRVQRSGARSLRLGLSRRGEAWLQERAHQLQHEG